MASTTGPAKIVVVANHSAPVRDRFGTTLEAAGHRAVLTESAADLLACLKAEPDPVDLVLVDLRLKGLSGVDLIQAIRRIGEDRLPILVFSGTVAGADEVRALAALGVAGYVSESSAPPQILPSLAPHLFPDNFNRRSRPRVSLGIPIQYRFGQTIAAALTFNLGHGGVAVRTTSPLEGGSRLTVMFRMPGGGRDVGAEGRVIWSDRRVGMGVQFETVDATDQTVIDHFVDAHFSSRKT